ncbi:MAG: ABC transporter substrate-binding protein [Clostridia bacterium]|nr:ABC transporter substrate-binding protein [Clostridia bacterium]
MDFSKPIIQKRHVPKSVLVILICLIILTFTGCSKKAGTVIAAPINSVPYGYDPQIAVGTDLETIINNIFEGLVRIDEKGDIQKAMATNWSISNDGLTYTFTIRSDSKWRVPKSASQALGEDFIKTLDTRVTAADFAFGINRAISKTTEAPLAYTLSAVDSAFAKNDTTLIIKLKKPSEGLLTALASPLCMPCNEKFFNETAGRYGLSTSLILSNGPFYLGLFDPDLGTITLKKNELYKGDYKPLKDTVRLYVESKNYNVKTISFDESKSINEKDWTVKRYKNAIKTFCFNCDNKVLSDYKNIRLAFAHSTNVDALVKKGISRAEGIIPSTCSLQAGASYRANANILRGPEYDVKKAAEIYNKVKEKNEAQEVPDDLSLDLKLVCLETDIDDIKTILQGWQKAFGIALTITLEPYETQEELDQVVKKGEYDIAYTTIVTSDFLASEFLKNFTSTSDKNTINLDSYPYDCLVDYAYMTSTKDELTEALVNCEQYLLDNAYFIPTIIKDTYVAFDITGEGVTLQPSGTVMSFYKAK